MTERDYHSVGEFFDVLTDEERAVFVISWYMTVGDIFQSEDGTDLEEYCEKIAFN